MTSFDCIPDGWGIAVALRGSKKKNYIYEGLFKNGKL